MKREFLINILFLISINLLIKPFYIFGIDRTVQNLVGALQYGVYFVLLNFTYLFQIINDFGIQNFNNRRIAQHGQLLEKYVPNILVLKLLLGLVYLLVTFSLAAGPGYWAEYRHLLILIAINHILIAFNFYMRSNVSGLAMYRTDSLLSALDKLLMILICGWLLWLAPFREAFQIEWFVYAQTVSLLLTIAVGFGVVAGRMRWFRFHVSGPFLLLILKESWPYALVVFLMTIYTRIDGVMLDWLLPDEGTFQAGIYASAYRLLDAVNMIGFLFAGLLLPMFARMIRKGESVEELLRFSFQLIWAGAISLSVACWFFREQIMLLLYTEATPYWGQVLGWLMFSFVAVSGTYIFGTLLTANGNLRRMNGIFVVAILLNILLNWWLIPQHKASGAAMTTLITQTFALLGQIGLAMHIFKLPLEPGYWGRFVAFAGVVALINYGLYHYGLFGWSVNFVVGILLSGVAALVFRLIHWKSFAELFKAKIEL